jgi:hypothetical protein
MYVEAMNFSGMGLAEYAAALGLSPHALRTWRDRLEESGNEWTGDPRFIRGCRVQLSNAANCTACHNWQPRPGQRRGERGARAPRARFRADAWWVDGHRDGDRAAGMIEPPHQHTQQPSIGRLWRAMARNLAIQLNRTMWHLCWTSVAAHSCEEMGH